MANSWKVYKKVALPLTTSNGNQLDVLFRAAYKAGLLRSDYCPTVQLTTIFLLCHSYYMTMPLYEAVITADVALSAYRKQTRDYFLDFILAGMLKEGYMKP
jgi:hypothetical protein